MYTYTNVSDTLPVYNTMADLYESTIKTYFILSSLHDIYHVTYTDPYNKHRLTTELFCIYTELFYKDHYSLAKLYSHLQTLLICSNRKCTWLPTEIHVNILTLRWSSFKGWFMFYSAWFHWFCWVSANEQWFLSMFMSACVHCTMSLVWNNVTCLNLESKTAENPAKSVEMKRNKVHKGTFQNPIIWLGLGWVGFGLGCLMTPGLSKDIRCHVWPYFF